MPSNALTISNVRTLLDQVKPQISLALPKHATADRFLRVALTQIRRNPKLMDCTKESLLGAIVQSAQLGLEPDGMTGFAYLVPYGRECTLIPGYKGLMSLARNAGIGRISARVICKNDDWDFEEGLNPRLFHKPNLKGERGEPILYYATANFRQGGELAAYEVMTLAEIEAVMNRSKAAKSGFSPWKTDFDAMAKKTVIRRMLKTAPVAVEMESRIARAVALDETAERGEAQNLGDVLDMPESGKDPQQVTSDDLFGKEDAPTENPKGPYDEGH